MWLVDGLKSDAISCLIRLTITLSPLSHKKQTISLWSRLLHQQFFTEFVACSLLDIVWMTKSRMMSWTKNFNGGRRLSDLFARSYNIRIHFRAIWIEDAKWIHLAQDRVLLYPVTTTEKSARSISLDTFSFIPTQWYTRNTASSTQTGSKYTFQSYLSATCAVLAQFFWMVIATFRTVNSLTRSSVLTIKVLVENCVSSNGRIVLSYKIFKKHSLSLGYLSGASDENLAEEILLFHSEKYRIQDGLHYTRSSTLLRNTRRCRECAGSNFSAPVNHWITERWSSETVMFSWSSSSAHTARWNYYSYLLHYIILYYIIS